MGEALWATVTGIGPYHVYRAGTGWDLPAR
jgi:hypothetical protein